jgi:hypothetical protein
MKSDSGSVKTGSKNWLDFVLERKQEIDGLEYKKILGLGKAGTGKTTFASTAPNWLFFDFDKNMRVIPQVDRRATHRIPFERGDDIETLVKNLFYAFKQKDPPFNEDGLFPDTETIVVDSIHKMSDWLLYYIIKNVLKKDPKTTKPGYDGYKLLKDSWSEIGEAMKDLPCNIIALAGVKSYEKENEGTVEIQPMIDGSYKDLIAHEFGEVYFFDREVKGLGASTTINHVIYTNTYKKVDMLKTTFKYPDGTGLPYKVMNPTYDRLFINKEFDHVN